MYRVDELARLAGTTVRNIRAYRERGLLASPQLAGRTGWYDETHLARLRLITRLLGRGYSLGNIAELLAAWERGRPFVEVLGVEAVLTRPRSGEQPWVGTRDDLAALAGVRRDDLPLERLCELGLAELDGDTVIVPLPSLLRSLRDLVSVGLPVTVVADLAEALVRTLDDVARTLVTTVGEALYPPDAIPKPVAEFDADLTALLAVADDAVRRIFGWVMERQVAAEFGHTVQRRLQDVPAAVG